MWQDAGLHKTILLLLWMAFRQFALQSSCFKHASTFEGCSFCVRPEPRRIKSHTQYAICSSRICHLGVMTRPLSTQLTMPRNQRRCRKLRFVMFSEVFSQGVVCVVFLIELFVPVQELTRLHKQVWIRCRTSRHHQRVHCVREVHVESILVRC